MTGACTIPRWRAARWPATSTPRPAHKAISGHALAAGFSEGYLVSAGIALLALIIMIVAIRVKKPDLAGVNPMAAPVA